MGSYEGVTYVSTNKGIVPKEFSEDVMTRLKSQFDYNKVAKTGKLKISMMGRILDAAKIEQNAEEKDHAAITITSGPAGGRVLSLVRIRSFHDFIPPRVHLYGAVGRGPARGHVVLCPRRHLLGADMWL